VKSTGPDRHHRTGGRVRSDDAREQVLDATTALLEEGGYAALTIEGVAARAQVAKSTIYRWWKSKPALVIDAYAQATAARMPEPDTGTVADDLTAFLTELYRVVDYPMRMQALRGLMAEAQLDPDFAATFRDWIGSRRTVLTGMLLRGIDRGELAGDIDLGYAADLIFGPFWYRLLVGHTPLEPVQAAGHVTSVLAALRSACSPTQP
jgi:AcrR family transcriptional regulator